MKIKSFIPKMYPGSNPGAMYDIIPSWVQQELAHPASLLKLNIIEYSNIIFKYKKEEGSKGDGMNLIKTLTSGYWITGTGLNGYVKPKQEEKIRRPKYWEQDYDEIHIPSGTPLEFISRGGFKDKPDYEFRIISGELKNQALLINGVDFRKVEPLPGLFDILIFVCLTVVTILLGIPHGIVIAGFIFCAKAVYCARRNYRYSYRIFQAIGLALTIPGAVWVLTEILVTQ